MVSRSEASIMKEIEAVIQMPDFKGYISDLGGPSANMYHMKGKDLKICENCQKPSCIFPAICNNLDYNHKLLTALYRKAASYPEVKKVTIGSGIRYDLLVGANQKQENELGLNEFVEQLIVHHVSGRLKVAPEHTSDEVLKMMRKPSFQLFHEFRKKFDEINRRKGLNQQLIPYFISSHPGCRLEDMAELAAETKKLGFQLEQVQDFTPTPMTLASVMYYTGLNPYTGKNVYVARTKEEKLNQRKFFFWYKPENQLWIKNTLRKLNKSVLIDRLLKK